MLFIAHDSSQATQSGNPAVSSMSTEDALEASRHVLANLNKDGCFIWIFKCLIKRRFNNTLTVFELEVHMKYIASMCRGISTERQTIILIASM